MPRLAVTFAMLLISAAALAACSPSTSPGPTAAGPASPPQTPPPTQVASVGPTLGPSASPGFAFDPESIVGYYETLGYTCLEPQPSSTAAGYLFRSCQLVDPEGRTRTIGIVTDPDDNVADAFASVRGAEGETVLDPAAVLDPFAAFLGAFLGEGQGSAALPWLAAHLGDADARTTLGGITLATYTDAPDDHSKLTVEIANQAYLDAPRPSASGG